uniref:Uncharacterized protein n=1 Tax=Arundo donax TaxID=35708 RepID=A0A0A9C0A2_ARUDO
MSAHLFCTNGKTEYSFLASASMLSRQ